ncbi:DUF4238 domain-containing protein [Pseudomonas sp. SED1]|uniref:DUF4238 domain-containing protein n=1 Tax=Pseudomonas sp. SED1 TaxID=3056845 RepID=UPI00296EB166|nr:DUF4238 domain-containing protein [Pseudomonas sp. SED1]MDY0832758.1 DUF4238 domain-containing protein [Pseudomonas sp. SED1]
MALDHYVSQVHLKNFYSKDLDKQMYAYRKSDLKFFTPNAKSVCRSDEGSTNEYLENNRVIEEFLAGVEPKYNSAVEKIKNKAIDQEAIYTISGFISYIITCSPAAMRIHSELFRGVVEHQAIMLDSENKFSQPPPQLGAGSMTELLKSGKIKINIDGKYPQAFGIRSILNHVSTFGNSTWEVLENPHSENPFFSSDFPVAIEQGSDKRALNRILPLTPQIAIRIKPNLNLDKKSLNHDFEHFNCKYKKLSLSDVKSLNRLFVRCAESIVFSSQNNDWTEQFIRKNSNYRIEPILVKLQTKTGSLQHFTQEVRKPKP